MRLTNYIVLLCNIDPEVGDGASPSLINFAAKQQTDAKQPWADQSPLTISALNGQSGYEVSCSSKDCGRGASAKFRKRGLFSKSCYSRSWPTARRRSKEA